MSRVYQMTRLGRGAYVVPSNDGTRMCLVVKVENEIDADGRYEWGVGRFAWDAADMTTDAFELALNRAEDEEDLIRDDCWRYHGVHRTREQALAKVTS